MIDPMNPAWLAMTQAYAARLDELVLVAEVEAYLIESEERS